MMTNMMQKLYVKMDAVLNNQKGAQAIEWIALAGVVLAVFAAIQVVFKDDESVGGAVSSTLTKIIRSIAE